MIERRWILLWIAFACGIALLAAPLTPMNQLPFNPDLLLFPVVLGAIGLQALGTVGMRAHLRTRGAPAPILITASFTAALAWGVAWLAATYGVASGPGGIVVGLLVMLPAALIALLLQIATLILFARTERRLGGAAGKPL